MGTVKKVCIVGSGNWGSAIAKIVGTTIVTHPEDFDQTATMYVYEEMIDGKKLSEIINTTHENVKYLPGIKLPHNILAEPDMKKAVTGADILIFVLPHQFIRRICTEIKNIVKKDAFAISLIKGLDVEDGLRLISDVIREYLGVPCYVLMGANLANEVSRELFCEATIGVSDAAAGLMLKKLFQTDYFRIVTCDDAATIELSGALKNIIATGAGFIDGLGHGNNTKAAVIRFGIMEMIKFAKQFYSTTKLSTFFESSGIADIVTTCYAGRNRLVASEFAKFRGKKSIVQLELEILNGQKVQGVPTAAEVNALLKSVNAEDQYPIFTAIHQICVGELGVEQFIDVLVDHTKHLESIESLVGGSGGGGGPVNST